MVDPTLPSSCHHTNFEKFVVGIRWIKSLVFEDKSEVSMSEVHRRARICGDLTFFNHHLISAVANKQTKTKSTDVNRDSWIIETNIGTVDLREHKYILINQKSQPETHSFLFKQGPDLLPNRTSLSFTTRTHHLPKTTSRRSGTKQREITITFSYSQQNLIWTG